MVIIVVVTTIIPVIIMGIIAHLAVHPVTIQVVALPVTIQVAALQVKIQVVVHQDVKLEVPIRMGVVTLILRTDLVQNHNLYGVKKSHEKNIAYYYR
jgi:hypothetical protein